MGDEDPGELRAIFEWMDNDDVFERYTSGSDTESNIAAFELCVRALKKLEADKKAKPEPRKTSRRQAIEAQKARKNART